MTAQSEAPQTVAALITRIRGANEALEGLIGGLSEARLTAPGGADGWSVKDHLAHIAVWEKSLLGLLAGRPRWQAMGVSQADWDTHDTDTLNAAIEAGNRDRSPADVMAGFHDTHQQVLTALARLTDTDLAKPYAHFQPDQQPPVSDPVIGWIHGNTWEHIEEHHGWIVALLEETRRANPASPA